ncbi:hypothetical protein EYC84_009469 [Monilinia fructicola]|uniref:Uncharacterized protein n=1 Tax=Monilinia fructicola TaxID=38448 RepID=A0A5M9JA20_MONFR|nr:hypothetical protein EYC84_009469 [Monilinia fructicola]
MNSPLVAAAINRFLCLLDWKPEAEEKYRKEACALLETKINHQGSNHTSVEDRRYYARAYGGFLDDPVTEGTIEY